MIIYKQNNNDNKNTVLAATQNHVENTPTAAPELKAMNNDKDKPSPKRKAKDNLDKEQNSPKKSSRRSKQERHPTPRKESSNDESNMQQDPDKIANSQVVVPTNKKPTSIINPTKGMNLVGSITEGLGKSLVANGTNKLQSGIKRLSQANLPVFTQSKLITTPAKTEVKIKQEQIDRATVPKEEHVPSGNGNEVTTKTVLDTGDKVPVQQDREEDHSMEIEGDSDEEEEVKILAVTKGSTNKTDYKTQTIVIDDEEKSADDEGSDNDNTRYKRAVLKTPTINVHNEKKPQEERANELRKKGLAQAADILCFREHYTRIQVVVPAPNSPITKEQYYKSSLGKIIDMIRLKGCSRAVLLPYKEKDAGKAAISTFKRLEERMSAMEVYFNGVSKRTPYNKDKKETEYAKAQRKSQNVKKLKLI